MTKTITCLLTTVTLAVAAPAFAASDMYLKFEGVDGEAAAPQPITSWSFGSCSADQCINYSGKGDWGSDQSAGKGATGANWDLATNKGARSANGVNVAAGDLNGDGRADLAYAGKLDSVSGLSLTFDKATPQLLLACKGKHWAEAILKVGEEHYRLSGSAFTCSDSASSAMNATGAKSSRVVSNIPIPANAPAKPLVDRCRIGETCTGKVTVTITGGQMKHTKTGHVTILK